jgi:hypothetical protein
MFHVPYRVGIFCDSCFFFFTVGCAVYRDLVQQFVALLELVERDSWFQQDSANRHNVNELGDFFGDCLSCKSI